jgi:hypothetical protein
MVKLSEGTDKVSEERKKIGIALLIAVLAIILFAVIILWVFSDDDSSSNNCIPPDPVTEGYDLSNVTGSLSKDNFTITGVRCASGYTGTASASACSVAGQAYTLSGCSDNDDDDDDSSSNNCISPDPVTEGYDLSNVTGSLSKDNFTITGVECATGYTGAEPSATACGTAGAEYTLSGCYPIPRTCADTNADGTPDSFVCEPSGNGLDISGNCQGDNCTYDECCTIVPTECSDYSITEHVACESDGTSVTSNSFDIPFGSGAPTLENACSYCSDNRDCTGFHIHRGTDDQIQDWNYEYYITGIVTDQREEPGDVRRLNRGCYIKN